MSKKEVITRKEFNIFKSDVDFWIKQIRNEHKGIMDYGKIVEENTNNIQHNYELILELKKQIDYSQEDINALKLMQLLQIKDKPRINN